MSNIKPDEDGNYTEKQWDNLPVAKRMRLCASGEYEIQRSDMTDAADRIEKLEAALVRTFEHMMEDGRRVETLEALVKELLRSNWDKSWPTMRKYDTFEEYESAVLGEEKND
jgi:hypothetical protein